MGPPSSHGITRVPRYSGYSRLNSDVAYVTFTLFGMPSHTFLLSYSMRYAVRTPKELLPLVWPLSISLATTLEISVDFFSSPYLDVSVQAVPLIHLCIQCMMNGRYTIRIAPFGDLRIKACLPLPAAYRS